MNKQSVRIGVDRFFYAPLISDEASGISYDDCVSVPGVTEVSVTLNSTIETFYADDGPFETFVNEGDKEVKISLAGMSADVVSALTGASYSSTNGLIKDSKSDNPPNVAVGFRSQKANGEYRYVWIYKGKFSKSDATAQTKSGSAAPQADSYTYKATMRVYDGNWRQMLDSDDANCPTGLTVAMLNDATTGWFSSPDFVPVAPGTPLSDVAATTGSSSGEINLAFTAPSGATSVKAQVNTLAGWVTVQTAAPITAVSTTAIITGLTAGNTYDCRLLVVGGNSNGISNTDSATSA
ncbi:MAG: hypothetical protein KAQ68_00720 [Clostridiales bacterium]|nr:hypothetical protein [Clostridiales bacterium]